MAVDEDIVIVGAGLAGLSTALALHRCGIPSVVLESSESLRISGFALTIWANAWRALDAVGVGDVLRTKSLRIKGFDASSQNPSDHKASEPDFKFQKSESRCVKRKDLLEILEGELPKGGIRYSSRIVSIEESGSIKLVHLSDGSIFRTKVLIGCDGVNSMVAKWLGLQSPVSAGRSAIRGLVAYPDVHGFEPKFHAYFGGGVRCGFIPCDDKTVYWFCTFSPSHFKYDENEQSSLKMKQLVLSTLGNAPKRISDVIEKTELDFISCAPLKFRPPWNMLTGSIVRNSVCVAGDALHPMTPDIGQGGCSALEDGVVLAKCLAESLLDKSDGGELEEGAKMERGLKKYEDDRRWRSFGLISAAYVVGLMQGSDGKVMSCLKRLFLTRFSVGVLFRMADFDCGKLPVAIP